MDPNRAGNGRSMRAWTCKDFTGHYPVGTAAVIVAESEPMARALLDEELRRQGLQYQVTRLTLLELDLGREQAVILRDGDY